MSDTATTDGIPVPRIFPGAPLPPAPPDMVYPFFYASLTVCEVLYLVEADRLRPYLKDSGLELATFDDGLACAGFDFQMYQRQMTFGMGSTMEIELNIVAYPTERKAQVPALSFADFVAGMDQTKLLGNKRVWVPCDDPIAINAGITLYGEPKFLTQFIPAVPALNSPGVNTWEFTCCDPAYPPASAGGNDDTAREHAIYTCTADVTGLTPALSNPSPFTEYGYAPHDGPDRRLIGCRWNIFQPFSTVYLAPEQAGRVKLTYGDSTHPMQKDIQAMIGDAPARVFRTSTSMPSAVNSRSYYP